MTPCAADECPALVARVGQFCAQHREAVLASAVGCAKRRCVACRRAIKAEDYVRREQVPRKRVTKAGDPYGWQHVACEPARPRKAKSAGALSLFDEEAHA